MQNSQTKQLMIELPKDPIGPSINDDGYPDHVYFHASTIYQNCYREKSADEMLVSYGRNKNVWIPDARDEESRVSAYELAFNSLKYQDLLETIISDCPFISYAVPDDLMSLVVVMLFDFQDRKFVKRKRLGGEDKVQDVTTVEACLFRFKTKVAACLARIRIKFNLPSIECVLPETVKERQKTAKSLLRHAWVNTQKASVEDVRDVLTSEGFSEVGSVQQLQGPSFCLDPHCEDVLLFPPHLKAELGRTELVSTRKLVIQDKSCSVPVNAVRSLLKPERCVLMTGVFSAMTVAHTAAIAAGCMGRVLVCESGEDKRRELRAILKKMGCRNVDLIPKNFMDLDPMDSALEQVRVILMMPLCSLSAVSNPAEFMARENGDTDLLQDLCRGTVSQGRLGYLVSCQTQEMEQALKIPKANTIVYSTFSSLRDENMEVVNKVVHAKSRIYKLSATGLRSGSTSKVGGKDIFQLEASTESNGVFVSVLTRVKAAEQPETRPEPAGKTIQGGAKGEELASTSEIPQNPLTRPGPGKPLRKKTAGKKKQVAMSNQASSREPPPQNPQTKKNNSGSQPAKTKT